MFTLFFKNHRKSFTPYFVISFHPINKKHLKICPILFFERTPHTMGNHKHTTTP